MAGPGTWAPLVQLRKQSPGAGALRTGNGSTLLTPGGCLTKAAAPPAHLPAWLQGELERGEGGGGPPAGALLHRFVCVGAARAHVWGRRLR